ncbi:MAG: DUF1588 domain-containing protein [Deltaproteobacteria bacterium]|nr:DUF1588 domain-containing protein [Deltaproteobacteria bacterium]
MAVRRPAIGAFGFGLALGSLVVSSCSGKVDSAAQGESGEDAPPGNGDDGAETVPPGQVPDADRCAELRAARLLPTSATMRRLSWDEINNAWTDLFPQTRPIELAAQAETSNLPLRTQTNLEINETFIRTYRPALETFIGRAAQALITTGNCRSMSAACLEGELLQTAKRAWRHNLEPEERTFLQSKLAAWTAEVGAVEGFAAALQLVLTSPRFLFLADPGAFKSDEAEDTHYTATGDRLAGLWAAAVWASVPDDALLAASANGDLKDNTGREQALDRMLADPRAKRGFTAMFRAWFAHNQVMKAVKDEALYPAFNDDVRKEMLADTEATLSELVFDAKETPNALLSSSLGSPGTKMVELLGWNKKNIAAKRQDLQRVGRHGIATHPAVLAITSKSAGTSIVNRGRFVVEKLACGHVPPPPKNLDIDQVKLEEEAMRLSGRQVAQMHASDPACATCHRFMDPFGMAFENFDPIGRERTLDNGFAIDTSVELNDALGITGKFAGAAELLNAVATTGRAEHCFASNFAGFVMPVTFSETQACALTPEHKNGEMPSMLSIARTFLLSDLFLLRSQASL